MADHTRLRRIAEQMKQELAVLFRDAMDDSRLAFISITHVDVVRDLSAAKIFVTYIGAEEERAEMVELLNEQSRSYRYELSHRMQLRTVPAMTFLYDDSIEKGANLQRKIEQLNAHSSNSEVDTDK